MSRFNFSLRTKLIIYFILIVLIPIIFIIVFFNILGMYLNNNSSITEVGAIIDKFETRIENNIQSVNNYKLFKDNIDDLLVQYEGELQIIDSDSNLIVFNSENSNISSFEYNKLNISGRTDTDNFTYLEEVNTEEGNYVYSLVLDMDAMYKGVQGTVMKYIVVGIATSIILLGFLVYYFSQTIARQILIPLEELNEATKNIAEGNLDYEIDYCDDNELGRFCDAFETMRLKLKQSLEKQSQYENSRKELIASISHDLKTPITSIQGYIEGLIDGIPKDVTTYNKYLEIIKDKAIKLNHLIDDLFYFSKLELDRLNIDKKEFQSSNVFEEILKPIELEFEQIEQELIIDRSIPNVKIKIDKNRIIQVVDNIVKNAREFIDEDGYVKISFEVIDNYFKVSISDNGVGIRKEDKSKLFNKFFRGEKSRSRKFGGTGLGLAICREIIESHNGKIGVESNRGEGAKFYFELPIIN